MDKRRGFKRKQNKIPLNLLSTRRNSYRSKHKIKRTVLNISIPQTEVPNTPEVAPVSSTSQEDTAPLHEEVPTSTHTKRKENMAARWEALRNSAYNAVVQNQAVLLDQQCFNCSSNDADVRCEQCGPMYMCYDCCIKHHDLCNYHHCPEKWQVHHIQLYINYSITFFVCFLFYFVRMIISYE